MCIQSNIGASTVMVHEGTATGVSLADLDVSQLMSTTSESAMSIEINNCIFRVSKIYHFHVSASFRTSK